MEKMILKDKTEVKILEGAAIGSATAIANDWNDLGTIAETLRKDGNLDEVQFASGENVTGKYKDMILESPLFTSVDITNEKIHATFAMREKTVTEKRLDALEAAKDEFKESQSVQDGAIMEMAEMLGEEA